MAKRLTKAEQAEAGLRVALSWPEYPCPEPLSKEVIRERTAHLGFGATNAIRLWTHNTHGGTVSFGCVGRSCHAPSGDKTTSQGCGGPWFDTQEDAYRALRWAVTRRLAEELLTLDARISRELADRSPA